MATTAQKAEEWKVKRRSVAKMCKDGMIPEASKNFKWYIPDDAEMPP